MRRDAPSSCEVDLSPAASADLLEIASYIAARRGRDAGDAFLDQVIEHVAMLERFPLRGSMPRELADHGIAGFRQINWGKYRIVYAVPDGRVVILLIADGRRDMAALLRARLLTSGDPA